MLDGEEDQDSEYHDYIGDNQLIDQTATDVRPSLRKKKDPDGDNVQNKEENEGGEDDEEEKEGDDNEDEDQSLLSKQEKNSTRMGRSPRGASESQTAFMERQLNRQLRL